MADSIDMATGTRPQGRPLGAGAKRGPAGPHGKRGARLTPREVGNRIACPVHSDS